MDWSNSYKKMRGVYVCVGGSDIPPYSFILYLSHTDGVYFSVILIRLITLK